MAGYNRVVMMGNLTRDPEYKQLTSGQAVCRLGLASNRQFKNRQTGDMVQEVCYVDIDVWGAQAESCRQYLQKGRPILVEGRLKFDSWQDPQGQNRNKLSIVADRVVFLSAAAESTVGVQQQKGTISQEPENELEQDLLNQIDKIKQKKAAPKKAAQELTASTPVQREPEKKEETASTGEVSFQDQPPFQDDLPF